MTLYWPFLISDYFLCLEMQAAFVAIIILISSVDDLFIDSWYWIRRIYRAVFIAPHIAPLTEENLRSKSEQTLAIMIPAWQESDVIATMVENLIRTIDYKNYLIFVGTYVNDPDTISEVNKLTRRYRHLRRVEVPTPGPTCKADCLNRIVKEIANYEKDHDVEIAGYLLHDSEDVTHPLELKLFNYLLPRKDFIQIPVMSLEREWYEIVAGVYMDEFAEWHAKDLIVRESLANAVPSAGVGTCFSRKAMAILLEDSDGEPFNTESLTEDYDIASRLSLAGMKTIIVAFPVKYQVSRKTLFGFGKEKTYELTVPLGVREYFPDTFWTSTRQKSRWILGIGLQGWKILGWKGSLLNRYLLFRDRKGLVTALITIYAYLLMFQFLFLYLFVILDFGGQRYVSLFVLQPWLISVMIINAIALLLRIVQRIYFVNRIYGWENALMSVPRLVIGNFINFFAVYRAWRLFLANVFFGKKLVWDKTAHNFPSDDVLLHKHQRIGELLVSWQAIDEKRLEQALRRQADEGQQPLGHYLIDKGWIDEDMLADAISYQSGLPRAAINKDIVLKHRELLSLVISVRWQIIPIGIDAQGRLVIAVMQPLSDEQMQDIFSNYQHKPVQHIATREEIDTAIRWLANREKSKADVDHAARFDSKEVPLLGHILVEKGFINYVQFQQVLQNYHPEVDGKIGEYLVKNHVLSLKDLAAALEFQLQGEINQAKQGGAESDQT